MNPAEQLRAIDAEARQVAATYKRRAVDLVAKVYEQQGSQSKAAQVLGITQGRVSQLLKERKMDGTELTGADAEVIAAEVNDELSRKG